MAFIKTTSLAFIAALILTSCGDSKSAGPETITPQVKALAVRDVTTKPEVEQVVESVDPVMKRGKRMFLRCKSCHTLEEGGRNGTGPNLYGIFGAAAAYHPDFKYSSSMLESGIIWNDETMDAWIEKPRDLVPGTSMAFAGLKKAEDRAALIAYLKKTSE